MSKTFRRPFHDLRLSAIALPVLCALTVGSVQAQNVPSTSRDGARKATAAAQKPARAPAARKAAPRKTPAKQPAQAPGSTASAPAAATAPAAAPRFTAGPREADFIVAVVNTEPVTNNEVRARMLRAQKQLAERGVQPPPTEQLRKEILERLIAERAQLQYAKETGLKVDDSALQQAELAIARQNGLATIEQLHQRVQQEGLTVEEFRDDVRNQVLLARLREREIDPKLKVTDTEVDSFIREQTGARAPAPDINLAMILVAVPENASDEERAKLQARAEEAARRVRGGEDFAKVATEFSDANNRGRDGGVLGLRPADKYPELFVRAVQRARQGDIVGPVKSDAGFHVLKLLERKQNKDLPEVRIPQTRVRHILLKVGPTQSEQVARDRAADIRRRIESRQADFATLARQYSQDDSAADGGDLGWTSPGQFVPEFEQAMNNLDVGQISPPVVSRFGVHLIRVDERAERTLSSDEQRQLARNMLREKKIQEAFETWAREVRGRAYVEYREPPR